MKHSFPLTPLKSHFNRTLSKEALKMTVVVMAGVLAALIVVLVCTEKGETCVHEPPVVVTTKGSVRGERGYSELGKPFSAFYGIPYAQPPLGPLRFQNPVEIEPWQGTRNGSWQPPPCVQMYFIKDRSLPKGIEDCLYLNVFTPKVGEGENLPVMVFLHGGGYVEGSASQFLPDFLLNHPIILVVPQFRIGALGFLSTEDSAAPGNLMLKDQRMALLWVKDNIARFGGDPGRVTITGISAGGCSVGFHVLSPMTTGLFSRAILHSGTGISPFAMGMKHRQVALETAVALGCPDTSTSSAIVACLQKAPISAFTNLPAKYYEWFVNPTVLAPRIDGEYIPAAPAVLLKEGRFGGVDLMTGLTAHDGSLLTHVLFRNDKLRDLLVSNFTRIGPISLFLFGDDPGGVASKDIYERWLGGEIAVNEATSDNLTKMVTEYYFGMASDYTALYHSRYSQHSRVYQFEFSHRGQYTNVFFMKPFPPGQHWVTHGDDMYYLFPGGASPRNIRLTDPKDVRVKEVVTKMWTNFIATGNPTPDDSLGFKWEAVTKDGKLRHLAIQPNPVMVPDQRAEVREFLATLIPVNEYLQG